jgi:hypothetical protein
VYIKVCEIKLHKVHFSIAQTLLQDIIKESSNSLSSRERERERERECFSMLISGIPSGFFDSSRGLRHGILFLLYGLSSSWRERENSETLHHCGVFLCVDSVAPFGFFKALMA